MNYEKAKERQQLSLCKCGHWKAEHSPNCKSPISRTDKGDWALCSCNTFRNKLNQ